MVRALQSAMVRASSVALSEKRKGGPMLRELVTEHRAEVIASARAKLASGAFSHAASDALERDLKSFFTELAEIFLDQKAADVSGIAQLVHRYGAACECLRDWIADRGSPIANEERHELDRCLSEAIAQAATEFLAAREELLAKGEVERFAALAHEQRNLISVALVAFQVLRRDRRRMEGKIGAALGRALIGLREITNRSTAGVRSAAGVQHHARIDLSEFIEQMKASASLEAAARGIRLTVRAPPRGITVDGDRLDLASAVSNLLNNAFKFSHPKGRVRLRTIAAAGDVRIEVEDECGGLPAGLVEDLFRPFERRGTDRTGLGLGLAISRQGIQASGGTLEVRNLPGKGCVFCIHLPMAG
jgi:signal transduction histidine kinase